MLGFALAFMFSMASSHHDLRKKNVLEEANSIGTAYLRADLIDKQYETEVKSMLREYVDIRLKAASGSDLDAALAESVNIHRRDVGAGVSSSGRGPQSKHLTDDPSRQRCH